MNGNRCIAQALAESFVAGQFETEQLVVRGTRLFGKRWRWIRPLAQRIVEHFGDGPRPRVAAVTSFIVADRSFVRAVRSHNISILDRLASLPSMSPSKAATTWMVPEICSTDELAAWLGVTINELDWFADLKLLANRKGSGKLTHYHYRPLTKRPGAIRLIESPKARLKSIQRQILCGIIDQIPAHDAVHGFRRGRSIQSFAEPHVNKHIVLKMDLQDFFPSILMARVQALFRTGGYPEKIADSLAGLCSNATPLQIWESFDSIPNDDRTRQIRWMYARPHLPQGAPTSPAVANLCAYRLDCRLSALAQSVGAVYTRYADDLAFSGNREFARNIDRFIIHVGATVMEEGFRVNHRKTRKMRPGVRQQIAGIVVNQHLAVPRRERDQLKATLSNCIRFGPGTQNRNDEIDFRSHLLGRITYIESVNPNHGRKLRELYNEIQWDSSE